MKIYRRHLATCGDSSRKAGDCACPWWGDYKFLGGRHLNSLRTADRKAAEKYLRKLIKEGPPPKRKTAKPGEVDRAEYVDWMDRFIEDRKRADLTERTVLHYHIILEAFGARKGDYKGLTYLDEIDHARIEAFQSSREGRSGGRPTQLTLRTEMDVLRAFSKYCIKHGAMLRNHASEIKIKVKGRQCTPPFADDELAAILGAANGPVRVLIELMARSGLRIGDAVSLRRDDIDGTTIRRKMQKSRYLNEVTIPLGEYPELLAELEALPASDPDGLYFFHDGETDLMAATEYWRQKMRGVFARAKVKDAHPHRLRDTFAVNLIRRGVPIHVVSLLLGHQNVTITQKYYAKYNPSMETLLVDAMKKGAPKKRLVPVAVRA
jgi:integrase/recombinase XerD